MTFNPQTIIDALDDSFYRGGIADFRSFLSNNIASRRWIIAADFNVELQNNAASRVFSFSCFPTTGNYNKILSALNDVFPQDFKNSRDITKAHISFAQRAMCFNFVILVQPKRLTFTASSRSQNLREARGAFADAKAFAAKNNMPTFHVNAFNNFLQYSLNGSASLDLIENVLLLCSFYSFVSRIIASNTPVELIGWFPDRDKMTTVASSAWAGMAHIICRESWLRKYPKEAPPEIGIWDHRVNGEPSGYDPLIKVPDFFSATLSRWHLSTNILALPSGMSKRGQKRYKDLIKAWVPENDCLWIGRLFADKEDYRTTRIAATRSKVRAKELNALKEKEEKERAQLSGATLSHNLNQ